MESYARVQTMRIHNICEKPIMSADCVLNSKLWHSLNTTKTTRSQSFYKISEICVNNILSSLFRNKKVFKLRSYKFSAEAILQKFHIRKPW